MTLKGVIRTIERSHRRQVRAARQRQRELETMQRNHRSMEERQRAQYAVQLYENLVERLTSMHKECAEPVDWTALMRLSHPAEPRRDNEQERAARDELETYRPGIFARLFGKATTQRAHLELAVEAGRQADEARYQHQLARHAEACAEVEGTRLLATRVAARDHAAYAEAIRELGSLDELAELGSSISMTFPNADTAVVQLSTHDTEVIPTEQASLTKAGKLSTRALSKTDFQALYQDYVCGCAFRVGREVFAALPVDWVICTATCKMLDPSTGHLAEQAILSIAMPRPTMAQLNFERLDPSDALAHFVHRMKFNKTKGFSVVEPLSESDVTTVSAME